MSLTPSEIESLAAAIASRLAAAQPRLLGLPELADRLALSKRGVTGLVKREQLPRGYLIGGSRRWDWDEVLRFLSASSTRRRRGGRGTRER